MYPFISRIDIENIRSIGNRIVMDCASGINVLVGKNNGGKSTILRSIQIYQHKGLDNKFINNFPRIGHETGRVIVTFDNPNSIIKNAFPAANVTHPNQIINNSRKLMVLCKFTRRGDQSGFSYHLAGDGAYPERTVANSEGIANRDGANLMIYFLSKRKVVNYQYENNAETTFSIRDDFRNLNGKISRIKNSQKSVVDEFNRLTEKILGIDFSATPVPQGVDAGIHVDGTTYISATSMGEGTAHILSLICDLCLSTPGKIFLIEELENDLHPLALKALLELIIEKSSHHQFFVSTHSNIVLKYLGGVVTSRVFNFSMTYVDRVPTTEIQVVDGEYERQNILQSLGYELFDFGLWQAYVILEESSAQAIIEHILVPYFVPELKNKVKFISANTASQVDLAYIDFHRLFVYLHKTEIYKNSSWVIVDGDDAGRDAIKKLTEKFPNVDRSTLTALSKDNFELYYPTRFQAKASSILGIKKQQKRVEKIKLVEEVKDWAKQNPADAKTEFSQSAAEVINVLKTIKERLGQ